MARVPDVPALVKGVLDGSRAALARAITLVESHRPDHRAAAQELLQELLPRSGDAHRVGISGVPGVGKSTFVEALGTRLTGEGHRVAVLAVDPSSTRTGGSILGDKTRMARLAVDEHAFVRPSPSAGTLGGVARATRETIVLMEAAGYDVVLVETVGVGQSEVEIAGMADTTLVLLAPGMGDGIQAAKAGILEVGDIYVVNKADRDGVQSVTRDLRSMLALAERAEGAWTPPILKTVASRNEGVAEVVQAIEDRLVWMRGNGVLTERRQSRARDEIEAIATTALRARFAHLHGDARLDVLAAKVADGGTDPYSAADELIAAL